MAVVEMFDHNSAVTTNWRARANCRGSTELFFARRSERPQARERREAKAATICASCVVKDECRLSARTNDEWGYWGGESEQERHLAGFAMLTASQNRVREALQMAPQNPALHPVEAGDFG